MKKILFSVASVVALSSGASAGMLVDFEAGAGVWMANPGGNMSYNKGITGTKLDLDGMGMDTTTNTYLYADFNHFVPFVPNIRVERQDLSVSGTAALNANVTFAGKTYSANAPISTSLDLTQNDLILYWGIPGINLATAGILDVNFGLDIKHLDGTQLKLTNATLSESVDVNAIIPMGYLNATVDMPFAPIQLSGTLKQISYKSSKLAEQSAKVSYKLPIPLPLIDFKIDAGYKRQVVVITDELVDDVNVDVDFSGMFFGLSAKF